MPANHTPTLYGIMAVRPAGVWIRTEAGTVNQRQDTLQPLKDPFKWHQHGASFLWPIPGFSTVTKFLASIFPRPYCTYHISSLWLYTHLTPPKRSERRTHACSSVVQASRAHSRVKQVWVQIPGPLLTNSVSLMKQLCHLGPQFS